VQYRGIVFDLYGTLVRPFRRREHVSAVGRCAEILGVSADAFHQSFIVDFQRRMRGELRSAWENLGPMARALGAEPSADALCAAQEILDRFVQEGLEPLPRAVPVLEELRRRGARIGLCSNCSGEVPARFARTPLAPFFDAPVFSSDVGFVKPDPRIYEAALSGLNLHAEEVLYVGDGSDGELTGAAACGMRAVLIEIDLSNTYDVRRTDVDDWRGDRVHDLLDVLNIYDG
jgi:putative hydrolase of the HAD superfamily